MQVFLGLHAPVDIYSDLELFWTSDTPSLNNEVVSIFSSLSSVTWLYHVAIYKLAQPAISSHYVV